MNFSRGGYFASASRYFLRLVLILLCLNPALGAWGGSRYNYVSRLLASLGVPYYRLNCSQYICMAKQQPYCNSADMYDGCYGALELIEQVPSLTEVDYSRLRAGDIAAFHGAHVAAYITGRTWVDSDPEHGGVGIMKAVPHDPWFSGPVRILRWKS
jgi:hypothetical protein